MSLQHSKNTIIINTADNKNITGNRQFLVYLYDMKSGCSTLAQNFQI